MITQRYTYVPMSRQTIDGSRHYVGENIKPIPSVTTILDKTKPEEAKQALAAWKQRVGEENAKKIVTEAANRGTRMHTYLEHYIKNDEMKEFPSNPFAQPSWYMAAQVILDGLKHVDEFWGIEVPVYYPELYAGTTDCVGVWKGKSAIIDFKQSNKVKKREWIEDYFLQLAAYSLAHDQIHNTKIEQGIILMCVQPVTPEATPQYLEFEINANELGHYQEKWIQRVDQYYEQL